MKTEKTNRKHFQNEFFKYCDKVAIIEKDHLFYVVGQKINRFSNTIERQTDLEFFDHLKDAEDYKEYLDYSSPDPSYLSEFEN